MGSRIVKTTRGNCGSEAAMMDVRCMCVVCALNVRWMYVGWRNDGVMRGLGTLLEAAEQDGQD